MVPAGAPDATAIGTGPFKRRDTKCIAVVICPLQQDRTSSCPWYSDGCAAPLQYDINNFFRIFTRDGSSSPRPPGTTAIRRISDFAKSITESLCELTAGLPSLIPLPIAADPPQALTFFPAANAHHLQLETKPHFLR